MTGLTKSEQRARRELAITSKLEKFGVLTAKQLWLMNAGGLKQGNIRNALRVMREMESSGAVKSCRYGSKVFSIDGKFGQWEHSLLRNDFLIWKGWADKAVIEIPIRENGEIVLRADAGVKSVGGGWLFIEIDRKQKKKANVEKCAEYRRMGLKFCAVCYKERSSHFRDCVKYFIEDFRGN